MAFNDLCNDHRYILPNGPNHYVSLSTISWVFFILAWDLEGLVSRDGLAFEQDKLARVSHVNTDHVK